MVIGENGKVSGVLQPQCLTPACLSARRQLETVLETCHAQGLNWWDLLGLLQVECEVAYHRAGREYLERRGKETLVVEQ